MVSFPLFGLIFSVGLVFLAVVAQTAPTHSSPHKRYLDACGTLGAVEYPNITYDLDSACYKSISYNRIAAVQTREAIYDLFDYFYTFRDSALDPALGSPLSSSPVDILETINTIYSTSNTSDYQFHMDFSMALIGLHDASVYYTPGCYQAYIFEQPFHLYAPVLDGKLEVRVFKNDKNRGYEDCIVLKIDDLDPLPYLRDWTDKNVRFSKDPGVRLNAALVSQAYEYDTNSLYTMPGTFSQRERLPERRFVSYDPQCGSLLPFVHVEDEWIVYTSGYGYGASSDNATSFAENSRFLSVDSQVMHEKHTAIGKLSAARPSTTAMSPIAVASPSPPVPLFDTITKIGVNGTIGVFQLNEHPQVGVVIVQDHSLTQRKDELDNLYNNLVRLHKNGVANLIIDMQGNTGGYYSFASPIVQMFFPNKGILDSALPLNLRVTNTMQEIARLGFNKFWDPYYDSTSFYDYKAKEFYTNYDLFTKPVNSTRHGRTANYTEIALFMPSIFKSPGDLSVFPWTNKPSRIRLLTDGRCAYGCGKSAFYLTKYHNVTSYAIGGFSELPLSKWYAPGAYSAAINRLDNLYDKARIKLYLLPYRGTAQITVIEEFAPGSKVPLEYDPKQFPADHHLNYTSQNARHCDITWNEVAAHAWK
ncbi:hypothetical protein BGX23_009939 [Mortierella sp. AD031]|nr:hypothetical protein BGX23_009939 [Mortierella sp. AD031]